MVAPNGLALGAGIFAVGFALFRWAYAIEKFVTRLQSPAFEQSGEELEPADYRVGITAGLGAGVMLVGATVFVLALVSRPA